MYGLGFRVLATGCVNASFIVSVANLPFSVFALRVAVILRAEP